MLTFLRKIRRSLIDSGSIRKYLLYGIGEIFLVMIGILLALQVNNWNEKSKRTIVEEELLKQFQTELKSDIQAINETLKIYSASNRACKILIEHIKNMRPYHDSLNYHFSYAFEYEQFNLNVAAISNLNSRGVEIISNTHLRNEILQLYHQTYNYINDLLRFHREDQIAFVYPALLKHMETVKWRDTSIPNDYQKLINDSEFMNHLQWTKNGTFWALDYYNQTINDVQELLVNIEQELDNR